MDYDTLDENSEAASAFVQAWCQELPPLPRLQAADWAAGQYLTALVHLDHAYGIEARLVLDAQQAVSSYLAQSLRDVCVLTDGPDAELDASVSQRLNDYAASLEAMDFSPTWTADDESA